MRAIKDILRLLIAIPICLLSLPFYLITKGLKAWWMYRTVKHSTKLRAGKRDKIGYGFCMTLFGAMRFTNLFNKPFIWALQKIIPASKI